jgi:hypothetical protein
MAQLFLTVTMILRSGLVPLNQREVLVITTPIMMKSVFLLQITLLRELHQLHLTLMLVLDGQVVKGKAFGRD